MTVNSGFVPKIPGDIESRFFIVECTEAKLFLLDFLWIEFLAVWLAVRVCLSGVWLVFLVEPLESYVVNYRVDAVPLGLEIDFLELDIGIWGIYLLPYFKTLASFLLSSNIRASVDRVFLIILWVYAAKLYIFLSKSLSAFWIFVGVFV